MQVYDCNGDKIGKISDFILDKEFTLTHFLLSDSLIHEVEVLIPVQKRLDRPIISIEQVSTYDEDILSIGLTNDNIERFRETKLGDVYQFSLLKNVKIYDSNGRLTGRIVDAIAHVDKKISFVLGGSPLKEFNERIGLIPDRDRFLPTVLISQFDELEKKMYLSVPKSKLDQKASRQDMKRGINFDRYPDQEKYVFYRLFSKMEPLKEKFAYLDAKIAASRVAKDLNIEPVRTEAQLGAFVDLYNQSFYASPDPVRSLTPEETERFDPNYMFVACLAKHPVGFLYCPLETSDDKIGAIAGVGVLGTHRGRKIAYALLKHAFELFDKLGVQKVVCEVYEKNEPSRKMFESLGFIIAGYMVLPEEE